MRAALRGAAPRATARGLAVLAGYCVVSAVLFGWRLWPHPGRGVIGLGLVADAEAFIWEFGWWAHALTTGTNPFVTNVIYSPIGANLAWTATAPGLGLFFTPLTLLVGPVAAFNVAMLLNPAVSAWTAFLLCRYLTRSLWASVVAGFLFGFSSFVISHTYSGDVNLTPALIPLVALVLLRHLRRELTARGLALRLGVLLALELIVSTEVALTLTLALAAAFAIAGAVAPAYRRRLVAALAPVGFAYAVAALLAAPFVYYLVTDVDLSDITRGGDGDLLNILLPTRLIAAGGSAFAPVSGDFRAGIVEACMYVGIPALLMVALYLCRGRRTAAARFLALALVVAWVLALGTALRVDGHRVVALPWALALHVSWLANLTEPRLTIYATLAASVASALWIGSRRGRWTARPVALPVLAIASLIPATWHFPFSRSPNRVEFFTHELYKLCIPRGETLAIFPFGRFGDSNLYQAESGFWFRIAEGNLGRDRYPHRFVFAGQTVSRLQFYYYGPGPRPTMRQLKGYARQFHVDRIVVVQPYEYPSGVQIHAFGPVQFIGGVAVAPACGYDSLAGDTRRIPGQ